MIRGENIVKSYDITPVIKDVTINVEKGHIYGLLGANGAGKTTLIKLLTGIYRPDSGKVIMNDKLISESPDEREKIAYVPDDILFYRDFTVKEMKNFYSSTFPTWDEERYRNLREVFTFPDKKRVKHLSKGMKTQLSILLSLSSMPEIMLMDEPTSGLDPFIKNDVLNLLIDDVASRNTGMLISSHDISQLEQVCDKVGFMEDGKILVEEDLEELKQKYKKVQIAFKEDMTKEFETEFNPLSIKKRGRIYEIIIDMDYDLFLSHVKKYEPLFVEDLNMTLEEIFIYKMGKQNHKKDSEILRRGENEDIK